MNTERCEIRVSGVAVEVVRKSIKNLHLGVYPPNGRVRVAAPLALSDEAVRLAVVGKLGWIKRQQDRFEAQPRQSRREMASGESHYYLGRRYRLRVLEGGATRVLVRNNSYIELHAAPGTTAADREAILHRWYRRQIRALVPPLLEKWQPVLGVRAEDWRIKKMKTQWGACTAEDRRIWINLELAKKPVECLEYIVVHELAHLLERHHNDRFHALMERAMPQWRMHRDTLNRAPLAHEDWEY